MVNTDGGSSNPMIDRVADAVSVVNDGATANGIDDRDVPPHDTKHAGDTPGHGPLHGIPPHLRFLPCVRT